MRGCERMSRGGDLGVHRGIAGEVGVGHLRGVLHRVVGATEGRIKSSSVAGATGGTYIPVGGGSESHGYTRPSTGAYATGGVVWMSEGISVGVVVGLVEFSGVTVATNPKSSAWRCLKRSSHGSASGYISSMRYR